MIPSHSEWLRRAAKPREEVISRRLSICRDTGGEPCARGRGVLSLASEGQLLVSASVVKSPTQEPWSLELSKLRTRMHVSGHVTQSLCVVYTAARVHPLPVLCFCVLYCTVLYRVKCAKLLRLCQTLCDPMDYSFPASSVHEVLQARILEWVAMPSSRGSPPRD